MARGGRWGRWFADGGGWCGAGYAEHERRRRWGGRAAVAGLLMTIYAASARSAPPLALLQHGCRGHRRREPSAPRLAGESSRESAQSTESGAHAPDLRLEDRGGALGEGREWLPGKGGIAGEGREGEGGGARRRGRRHQVVALFPPRTGENGSRETVRGRDKDCFFVFYPFLFFIFVF
jgi:hypothetical protein